MGVIRDLLKNYIQLLNQSVIKYVICDRKKFQQWATAMQVLPPSGVLSSICRCSRSLKNSELTSCAMKCGHISMPSLRRTSDVMTCVFLLYQSRLLNSQLEVLFHHVQCLSNGVNTHESIKGYILVIFLYLYFSSLG